MIGLEELTKRYLGLMELYERAGAELPALKQELSSIVPFDARDSIRKNFFLGQILPDIENASEKSAWARSVYKRMNLPVIGLLENLVYRNYAAMTALKAAEHQVEYCGDFIDKVKEYLEEHRSQP